MPRMRSKPSILEQRPIFVCDNCGFKVDVNGDPFEYVRKKAKEIEEWEQNSPCHNCAFINYCKQGEQQNKNSTWKRRKQQFCMPRPPS